MRASIIRLTAAAALLTGLSAGAHAQCEPALLGEFGSDGAADIALTGSVAVVASLRDGVRTIDISDPTRPEPIATLETPIPAARVALAGDVAVVLGNIITRHSNPLEADGLLMLIDISDPAAPAHLGALELPDLELGSLAARGGVAFALARQEMEPRDVVVLKTIDISDPTDPQTLATMVIDEFSGSLDFALLGDLLYLSPGDLHQPSLTVVNVSNPAQPLALGSVWPAVPDELTVERVNAISIRGETAYVAGVANDHRPTLLTIDLSAPLQPVFLDYSLGTDFGHGRGLDVAANGSFALMTVRWEDHHGNSGSTITAFDVQDPTNILKDPRRLDFALGGICLDGALAFVSAQYDLLAFDLAQPRPQHDFDPPLLGVLNLLTSGANRVRVSNGRAYVTDDATLVVLDVSDPASPQFIGSFLREPFGNLLTVRGDTARFFREGKVRRFDFSDPRHPVELPSTENFGNVVGNLLFQVGSVLRILDISDPENPALLSELDLPDNNSLSFNVADGVAYLGLAIPDPILLTIDVHDPTQPQVLGVADLPESEFYRTAAGDGRFIVTTHEEVFDELDPHTHHFTNSDLLVIDVSDPSSPVVGGELSLRRTVFGNPIVSGDVAFIPDGEILALSLADPQRPFVMSELAAGASSFELIDGLLHAIGGGLRLLDISSCRGTLPEDFNDDGRIDGADLGLLLGQWGSFCPRGCRADLTGDQIIDEEDLVSLLIRWLESQQ